MHPREVGIVLVSAQEKEMLCWLRVWSDHRGPLGSGLGSSEKIRFFCWMKILNWKSNDRGNARGVGGPWYTTVDPNPEKTPKKSLSV